MDQTEAATQITLELLAQSSGLDTSTRTAWVIKTYKEVHQALADAESSGGGSSGGVMTVTRH